MKPPLPKPPAWLPFVGPLIAGVSAGVAGPHLGFWPAMLIGLVTGLIPVLGYQLWKRAHHQK